MADTPTLVAFEVGFQAAGSGPDGLPLYEQVIKIRKSRPPYLEVMAIATEEDIADHPEAYRKFMHEQKGLKLDGKAGYPLAMWPAVDAAELQMCLARDIHTVEDLSKLALRGGPNSQVPPPIVELAKRAKKMVELHGKTGKHEQTISNLEEQVTALREQNNELKATIETQRITIDKLQARVAA